MTNDQFRALEEISGNRSPSNSKAGSKADDLLAAAISAFAGITRPGRQDMQQLEDLVTPLLQCATTRGKRHAANALAQLEEAPRRIILALAAEPVEIPKLLRAYLALGAKICGPPALDREFKTIDFLTLLDLKTLPAMARQRFLGA